VLVGHDSLPRRLQTLGDAANGGAAARVDDDSADRAGVELARNRWNLKQEEETADWCEMSQRPKA